jgi:hypothetical protein
LTSWGIAAKRVGEEDQGIDLSLGDHAADLLVAPERPAPDRLDPQVRAELPDDTAGRRGTDHAMGGEFLPVARRPRRQGGFLLVVRDQGDGQGFHGPALAGEWYGQAHDRVRLAGNPPSVAGGGHLGFVDEIARRGRRRLAGGA